MNSPQACLSPTYRNLQSKQIQSPKDLKEKLRKDYKNKIQNCRNMLLNKFRGSEGETDLRSTLTNLYNDIFKDSSYEFLKSDLILDSEETKVLEEIRLELIQDELDWCHKEYEKAQMENIDWSLLQDENVICPICQKYNFRLSSEILTCLFCKISIKTTKSLVDIKNKIFDSIEKHCNACNNTNIQFSAICESNDTHIYLTCESCMEMKFIV